MLGDNMLVASIVEQGQFKRNVYLPKNVHGWYDYHSELWFEGGQQITIPAPIDYSPLLIKAGAIIPVNDAEVTFKTKSIDERGFMMFPTKGNGENEYSLYEDDGITNNYKKGICTFVKLKMKSSENKIEVDIVKEGNYQLPYDSVRIYFPKLEMRQIVLNNKYMENNNENIYSMDINKIGSL